MAQVVALQRVVWSGSDLEIVPGHLLLTAAHNGGLVAGAFAEDRLAGFVFGFLGFYETAQGRRLKHCSHMLGVHPDFRRAGIGAALKIYQREFVLCQGLDRITWTYDPLLARNAQLNIARLGAVCNTYLVNLYGDLGDDLNTGLPTDRFQVDWWIRSKAVTARVGSSDCAQDEAPRPGLAEMLARGAVLLNPPAPASQPLPPEFDPAVLGSVGLPVAHGGRGRYKHRNPAPAALRAPNPHIVLVEIPYDYLALKSSDPALALRWRLATRRAFEMLFDQGFTVTDFVLQASPPPRGAYVLKHEPALNS